MFTAIDSFLLDRVFQPIADWSHATLGKSCFWWAAQLFAASVVGMLGWLVTCWLMYRLGERTGGMLAFDFAVCIPMAGVFAVFGIFAGLEDSSGPTDTANDMRPIHVSGRVIWLGVFVVMGLPSDILEAVNATHMTHRIGAIMQCVVDISAPLAFYLIALQNYPPVRRRVSRLAEDGA